jgi:hypothetical protein
MTIENGGSGPVVTSSVDEAALPDRSVPVDEPADQLSPATLNLADLSRQTPAAPDRDSSPPDRRARADDGPSLTFSARPLIDRAFTIERDDALLWSAVVQADAPPPLEELLRFFTRSR